MKISYCKFKAFTSSSYDSWIQACVSSFIYWSGDKGGKIWEGERCLCVSMKQQGVEVKDLNTDFWNFELLQNFDSSYKKNLKSLKFKTKKCICKGNTCVYLRSDRRSGPEPCTMIPGVYIRLSAESSDSSCKLHKPRQKRNWEARLICLVKHTKIWEHEGKLLWTIWQIAAAALFITAREENIALFIFFNHSQMSE